MTLPRLTLLQRLVFSAVYADPGITTPALAARLRRDPSSIHRMVLSLEGAGLLRSVLVPLEGDGDAAPPRRVRVIRPAPWTVAP